MEQENITLAAEIEAASASLGLAPSTIGARAGQGGRFYDRIKSGRRVWPETADKVRKWIAAQSGVVGSSTSVPSENVDPSNAAQHGDAAQAGQAGTIGRRTVTDE